MESKDEKTNELDKVNENHINDSNNKNDSSEDNDKKITSVEVISNSNKEIINKIDNFINEYRTNLVKSDDDFRRMGFFCAVDENQLNLSNSLETILKNHSDIHESNLTSYIEFFDLKKSEYQEQIERLKIDIDEKKDLKNTYKSTIENLKTEIKSIEDELIDLRKKLIETLNEVSSSKEGLILKRFSEMDIEIQKLIEIHTNIEKQQNPKYKDEHDADKIVDRKEIDFYEGLKKDFEETYNDVKKRIKILNNAGVNNFSSIILIGIGILSSLVAGWFFSLWTGPIPSLKDGAITGNSSIKFNLIDLVAKYTTQFGWIELVLGILFYIFLIGLIGLLAYKLLLKYKFIDNKHKENKDEGFNFDTNEENSVFSGKFSGANFFSLWLKISPAILFIFLTISVIAKEAFKNNQDEFQKLFDSLTNQAMGNLSAFVIAGFVYLYITKITEPRYISSSDAENNESGSIFLSWEVMLIGICFFVMVICMFLSRISTNYLMIYFELFTISGYSFFGLITGFSIGFGLRYIGLDYTQNKLLNYLNICKNNIQRISKPRRDYFTDNQLFNNGILVLQHQMFNIIADRNSLANKITTANLKQEELPSIPPPIFIVQQGDQVASENISTENTETQSVNNEKKNQDINFFSKVKNWVAGIWQNLEESKKGIEKDEKAKNNDILKREISKDDEVYFPEATFKISELHTQLAEKTKKLIDLQDELEGFWTNKGLFKVVNDEIDSAYEKVEKVKDEKAKINTQINNIRNELFYEKGRQIALIKEGYLTGKWFLKENGDLYKG